MKKMILLVAALMISFSSFASTSQLENESTASATQSTREIGLYCTNVTGIYAWVDVEIYDANGNTVFYEELSFAPSGYWETTLYLSPGNYTLRAYSPGTIYESFTITSTTTGHLRVDVGFSQLSFTNSLRN